MTTEEQQKLIDDQNTLSNLMDVVEVLLSICILRASSPHNKLRMLGMKHETQRIINAIPIPQANDDDIEQKLNAITNNLFNKP